MLKIQENWDSITKAIRDAMKLISSFGFSRENITSNNLIIPIAYYLMHIGLPNNFEVSSSNIKDKVKIKKWFVLSLFKRVFSFMPDGVLKPVREIIKNNNKNEFPLEDIINYFKGNNRTLVFTQEDIYNLLHYKYGQGNTLIVLSILYPWADLRNNFHLDHINPKNFFTKQNLLKRGIQEENIEFYLENYNYIGNLQLLESIPNIEKSNMDFDKWIENLISSEAINEYKKKHHIPKYIDLSINNFEEFFKEREKLIVKKLEEELNI